MRRTDREITDRTAIDEIIAKGKYLSLAMSQRSTPYVIPVSYGYDGTAFYIHSAKEGKKLDIIHDNGCVAWNIVSSAEYEENAATSHYTVRYVSASGEGKAEIVEDETEKAKALQLIVNHYSDTQLEPTKEQIDSVEIIKVTVTNITGKSNIPNREENKMSEKVLHRSSTNKKIAGVCGGLGEYFDIDPTIVRLLWGISIVCYGFGLLAYIVAIFVMPKDVTAN